MLHFTGAQIFRVLFKKLDHTSARGLKLFCGLRQSGKAANWPGAFRRFHLVSAVRNHVQKRCFAIRRVGWARRALRTDQLELDALSGCQVLNRIKHGPAIGSRLQPALFFSDTGKAVQEYFAGLLQQRSKDCLSITTAAGLGCALMVSVLPLPAVR